MAISGAATFSSPLFQLAAASFAVYAIQSRSTRY
jgi:hypothetical protein